MQEAKSAAELDAAIQRVLGRTGLMLFVEFDHGMIVRKGTQRHSSRIIRLVIGNPLIMKEMAKHVPDAGSYAPVTVLVDDRADGVHLSYDRMASLLGTYGNSDALNVARTLTLKSKICCDKLQLETEERIRREEQREGRHRPEHSANLDSINFKALLVKL
jgi:uncharacterized protein (DUF302 family)